MSQLTEETNRYQNEKYVTKRKKKVTIICIFGILNQSEKKCKTKW